MSYSLPHSLPPSIIAVPEREQQALPKAPTTVSKVFASQEQKKPPVRTIITQGVVVS